MLATMSILDEVNFSNVKFVSNIQKHSHQDHAELSELSWQHYCTRQAVAALLSRNDDIILNRT
jgi:hypothetical protein